ncbi:hypothetical protein CCHR01_16228 [Colletotrichum chrysophilum]|uniref:Uncharacterized protein n=1 Tax=Colletotrichum chrysophilum TaxID=1836956 RepID=A0AAD9A4J6_9PEZI|nr:hypothetical protein CCHR01_16228 [Colletotrichum chrysophilum]
MFQSRCLCEPFDRWTAKERTAIRKPVRHPKLEELPLGFGLRLSSASYRYLSQFVAALGTRRKRW